MKERPSQETRNEIAMLSINCVLQKNPVKLGVSLHARACSCALRYFAVYREMVESEVYRMR